MATKLISGPEVLAVDLDVAKKNLRIDGDYLDDVVTMWLEGIIAECEHEIGQRLMRQKWRVTLDQFPVRRGQGSADVCTAAIALPHPVLSVSSVVYVDVAGVPQTMHEADYALESNELSTLLLPSEGVSWPATNRARGAVKIDVDCGYGDTPAMTPAGVRLYILARLLEQFDPSSRPDKDTVQSLYLLRLLDRCRTYA